MQVSNGASDLVRSYDVTLTAPFSLHKLTGLCMHFIGSSAPG